MRAGVDLAAGGFVHAAALHADEAVFDQVKAADAVLAAQLVESGQQRGGAHRLAIERNAVALLEIDRDIFGRVGRFFRVIGARIDVIGRLFPWVLEHFPFRRGVQQVGIGGEGAFAALVLGHGDLVRLGPGD